jgi:hypothetical protein
MRREESTAVAKLQLQEFGFPLISLHEAVLQSFNHNRSFAAEIASLNPQELECRKGDQIVIGKLFIVIILAPPCQFLNKPNSTTADNSDFLTLFVPGYRPVPGPDVGWAGIRAGVRSHLLGEENLKRPTSLLIEERA